MARHPSAQPTDVELQILRILWSGEASTARQIHNRLQVTKETTYSTTVKMLAVMLEKKLVRRDDNVRPQQYRAAATQQKTQKSMLKDFMEKLYEGSAKTLMLHALATKKATPEELEEIRNWIEQMERKK